MENLLDIPTIMKHIFILIISLLITSSCTRLIYGSSTDVVIYGPTDEPVNIKAIGTKTIAEYSNVTLPLEMKVKHKNLPILIETESPNYYYEDTRIGIKSHDTEGLIYSALGISAILGGLIGGAVTGIGDGDAAPFGYTALGGLAMIGLGVYSMVDVPDSKSYQIVNTNTPVASHSSSLFADSPDSNMRDAGDFLRLGNKAAAARCFDRVLLYNPSADVYYFRGAIAFEEGKYKYAEKLLTLAATTPGLSNEYKAEVQDALIAAQEKREIQRREDWTAFGAAVLSIAATATAIAISSRHANSHSPATVTDDDSDYPPANGSKIGALDRPNNGMQCTSCQNTKKCTQCRGTGFLTDNSFGTEQDPTKKCGICGGSGVCSKCGGAGRIYK